MSLSQPIEMDKGKTSDRPVPIYYSLENRYYLFYKSSSSSDLWYTYSTDLVNWENDMKIPDSRSEFSPSCTIYNGTIWLVYKGEDNRDGRIFLKSYDNRNGWLGEWEAAEIRTSAAPSIEELNNNLYIFFKGLNSGNIYYSKITL